MSAKWPRAWLDRARADTEGAKALLRSGGDHRPLVAYHVQQAAEKTVKAVLILRGIDLVKSHDIAALAERLGADDPLYLTCSRLGALSIYATAFRYPAGEPTEVPSVADPWRWLGEIERITAQVLQRCDELDAR